MNSIKFVIFAVMIASAVAAPTDMPAGQVSTEAAAQPSTEAVPQTTLAPQTTPDASTPAPQIAPDASTSAPLAASAPATDDSSKDQNTTSPMASPQDNMLNTSSFTCYGRAIGYYADVEQNCTVYHFCLLGEYNGEPVYQRISYLCLKSTVFDQQALDCVEPTKITAPCKESESHYEQSNAILRQSILGGKRQSENDTSKSSTASS